MHEDTELARDNWPDIHDLMTGLWPTAMPKHMTPELEQLWRDRLGSYPALMVKSALNEHMAQRGTFPKLAQILYVCKERHVAYEGPVQIDNYEQDAWNSDASWRAIDKLLANYSDSELREVRKRELEAEPRRAWMKQDKMPIQGKAWRAVTAQRIIEELHGAAPADRALPMMHGPTAWHQKLMELAAP